MKKKEKTFIRKLADEYRGEGAEPACPHFGECGGCLFQDIPYEGQLALKQRMVNDTLGALGAVDRVVPSNPYRYRSRMDLVAAFGRFGLRRGGSFRVVVDLGGCSIMREKSDALLKKMRPLVEAVEGYDYLRHKGYLRYAVLRETCYTGEVMASFVVAERENRLGDLLAAIEGDADSITLIHNGGLADLSFGEIMETVKRGHIDESFDGVRYRITPNSFFQSNAEIALMMYRRIRDEVRGKTLDLCAGVGSISLFIAGTAERVTGVEVNGEAVETARASAGINSIGNAEFVQADVRNFLSSGPDGYDTIVLDPPRSGMQQKVMEQIDRMTAGTIVYMSCNPKTFRDDVAVLQNYRLVSVEAFDMFPQTPHVELLGVLKRA